jgi:hypothetical protein
MWSTTTLRLPVSQQMFLVLEPEVSVPCQQLYDLIVTQTNQSALSNTHFFYRNEYQVYFLGIKAAGA